MGESCCNVKFCFISRHLHYELSYSTGLNSYRAGYKVPFNHLKAITFRKYYVNIEILHPAVQEYCNRESFVNKKHIITPCNELDLTQGSYKTALIHVIRLHSDESSFWIRYLLDGDRQFFQPRIRQIMPKSSNNFGYSASNRSSNNSLSTFVVNSNTTSLYFNHDVQNFDIPEYLSPIPSYMAQSDGRNDEVAPVNYNETAYSIIPDSFMSYSTEQPQVDFDFSFFFFFF
ncbi:unnamed protein product, partial [Onchocerca flexuosa]|uniref:Uncharacterized protein n=1 Tax=Onchocerca flexuosa TaxID=387005 RepID=A0A183HUD2_9BILA